MKRATLVDDSWYEKKLAMLCAWEPRGGYYLGGKGMVWGRQTRCKALEAR